MLAVVQDEQQSPRAQRVLHRFHDRAPGFFPNAKGRGGLLGNEAGISQRCEAGKAHPIVKQLTVVQLACHLECEPGLADPAGTGQGQQPCAGEVAPHLRQLPLTADKAAQRHQRAGAWPMHGGQASACPCRGGRVEPTSAGLLSAFTTSSGTYGGLHCCVMESYR